MSKKEKTVKAAATGSSEEDHYPIYVQSSNPSQALLDWMAEMSETRIVYFQSGNPPNPPPCPPGGC